MENPGKKAFGTRGGIWAALLLLLFGVGYLVAALQYPLGELAAPGPGLMPRLLGWVFIGLSLDLLLLPLIKRPKPPKTPEAGEAESHLRLKVPLQLTGILVLYWAFLVPLGFSLSTLLAMVFLSRFLGLKGWTRPILLGLGTVALAFALFVLVLDVPLPSGTLWGG